MLHHRLRSAGQKKLIYVGGAFASDITTGNITVSLTSLTGGIASAPSTGDVVLVAYSTNCFENFDMSIVTSGYTELADLYASDTNDTQLGVYAKVMGASPDTSVTGGGNGYTDPYTIMVQVWRNTNITSGIVTPISTATGTNTGRPNPPSVTPTVSGSIIVVVGAGTSDNEGTTGFTAPSGIQLFQQNVSSNDELVMGMGAYLDWASGAYDCAAFGGGSTDISDSWCAASIIIKPV